MYMLLLYPKERCSMLKVGTKSNKLRIYEGISGNLLSCWIFFLFLYFSVRSWERSGATRGDMIRSGRRRFAKWQVRMEHMEAACVQDSRVVFRIWTFRSFGISRMCSRYEKLNLCLAFGSLWLKTNIKKQTVI